jgi:hypothetical protein
MEIFDTQKSESLNESLTPKIVLSFAFFRLFQIDNQFGCQNFLHLGGQKKMPSAIRRAFEFTLKLLLRFRLRVILVEFHIDFSRRA